MNRGARIFYHKSLLPTREKEQEAWISTRKSLQSTASAPVFVSAVTSTSDDSERLMDPILRGSISASLHAVRSISATDTYKDGLCMIPIICDYYFDGSISISGTATVVIPSFTVMVTLIWPSVFPDEKVTCDHLAFSRTTSPV